MTKRCFVIMPFSGTSLEHTELYWTNFFEGFLKGKVERLGYLCERSSAKPQNLLQGILRDLVESDLVLAVLTDFNANVWYELGVRHAIRRGTIMMIEKGQPIPFDIKHYGLILYEESWAGSVAFESQLKTFVNEIETNRPIDSPALEFLEKQTLTNYLDLFKELQHDQVRTGRPTPAKVDTRRRRVLWIDERPRANESIVDLYRQQSVKFDLALNSEQAKDLLAKRRYDLAISDLPSAERLDDRLRLIQRLHQLSTPVIVFTMQEAVTLHAERVRSLGSILTTASTRELVTKVAGILEL